MDAPGEEPPPEITVEVSAWPLTPEGVKGAILEVVPHVKGCYEDGLDEVPDLGGALTVSFTVVDHDGVGRIDTVDLVHNELRDGPVEDCVLAAMRALQFDAPEDGQMTITYPLVFAPE